MRIAYFDPIGGAAGDMIVASLIDAGASLNGIRNGLASLELDEFELFSERTRPYHISSTRFRVEVKGESASSNSSKAHGRHLGDIQQIIERSSLSSLTKQRSLEIFRILAQAEAKVHGLSIDRVHFHEVGAVDSIVDIVGACIGLELLGVETVKVGSLPISYGFVECEHGTWPVPGPATVELLRGFKCHTLDICGETVTPTAAAFFAALADQGQDTGLSIEATGYGAGSKDYGIPNVLRVIVGVTDAQVDDEVIVVESCIDDQPPELFEAAMNAVFRAGALDVWFTPIHMKKNRPAVKLTALCSRDRLEDVQHSILSETSTLGVRYWRAERSCLKREIRKVDTTWGAVRIKVGILPGGATKFAPEYEDIKKLSEEKGIPAREIYTQAQSLASDNRFVEEAKS